MKKKHRRTDGAFFQKFTKDNVDGHQACCDHDYNDFDEQGKACAQLEKEFEMKKKVRIADGDEEILDEAMCDVVAQNNVAITNEHTTTNHHHNNSIIITTHNQSHHNCDAGSSDSSRVNQFATRRQPPSFCPWESSKCQCNCVNSIGLSAELVSTYSPPRPYGVEVREVMSPHEGTPMTETACRSSSASGPTRGWMRQEDGRIGGNPSTGTCSSPNIVAGDTRDACTTTMAIGQVLVGRYGAIGEKLVPQPLRSQAQLWERRASRRRSGAGTIAVPAVCRP